MTAAGWRHDLRAPLAGIFAFCDFFAGLFVLLGAGADWKLYAGGALLVALPVIAFFVRRKRPTLALLLVAVPLAGFSYAVWQSVSR